MLGSRLVQLPMQTGKTTGGKSLAICVQSPRYGSFAFPKFKLTQREEF